MKRTKLEQKIYNLIEIEFCKYLNLTHQSITDSMNAGPCPLGSEKHFDVTAKQIVKAIRKEKSLK